jgi:hypothetical protein
VCCIEGGGGSQCVVVELMEVQTVCYLLRWWMFTMCCDGGGGGSQCVVMEVVEVHSVL